MSKQNEELKAFNVDILQIVTKRITVTVLAEDSEDAESVAEGLNIETGWEQIESREEVVSHSISENEDPLEDLIDYYDRNGKLVSNE